MFQRRLQSTMTSLKDIGTIEMSVANKTYEETWIQWRIPGITTITNVTSQDMAIHYKSPIFSIEGVSCDLELFPVSGSNDKYMRLFISFKLKPLVTGEFNISLKKIDGTEEHLARKNLEAEDETYCDVGNIIKRSEIRHRKSELAPQDVLTLICRLQREITNFSPPTASDKTKPMVLIKLDKLSQNFKDLFDDKETCDVTLKVKMKEYEAHRSVLIARSSVFASYFKHDTLERQTGNIIIDDCDADSFLKFLEYLYCGKLEGMSYSSAFHLYYTSDKYDVEDLKTFCVEYLKQSITVESLCEIVVFADQYEEAELFSAVQDFYNKNVASILDTSQWDGLLAKNRRLANKLYKQAWQTSLK